MRRRTEISIHRTSMSSARLEFLPQVPLTLNVASRFRNERLREPTSIRIP